MATQSVPMPEQSEPMLMPLRKGGARMILRLFVILGPWQRDDDAVVEQWQSLLKNSDTDDWGPDDDWAAASH
jgi:hypothetical protein